MLTALSESSGETINVIVKPCKNAKSCGDFSGKEKPLSLRLVNAQAAAERDNGPEAHLGGHRRDVRTTVGPSWPSCLGGDSSADCVFP